MKKLFFLLVSGVICQTIDAGVYRHDVDAQKYKDLASQKQFDCAGLVIEASSSISGSCVLIGDRYVLCAAHVFIKTDPAKPDTSYVNSSMVILNRVANPRVADVKGYTFRFKREIRYAKSIIVHPVYLKDISEGNCDLALIELSEPVTDIKPAKLNTAFDELNCIATGVGWGASGKANEPENVAMWFEEIAGQNRIDNIAGYEYNGKQTSLEADFDHPINYKDCNKMGGPEPLPLEYMTSGGDSGGGLFRQGNNDEWELIGICTGGGVDFKQLIKTGYYGQKGGWTRVSVFNDWITKTIKNLEKRDSKTLK